MESDARAAAPVAAVVVLIGLTVAATALVGPTALALADLDGSPPTLVADSDGPIDASVPGSDDDQTVVLRHASGDSVPTAELEIVVRLPEHDRESRLTALPIEADRLPPDGFDGDDLVDRRAGRFSEPLVGESASWTGGERLAFRIKTHRGDGVVLDPGDSVAVTVVHEPTETVLVEETLSVA